MRDLRHSANLLRACVFCCYICKKLSSCLFKTHPPNDCILSSWSTYFCNLSVFLVCVQDHSLFWCGVSCNVPPLFDFLLNSQEVFGLVVAIPALLFLACLHIEFARVYLLFCERTSNSVDISFGLFFFVSNSQWCPDPVLTEKLENVPVKKKSHRGAWSMPGAQTTTLSDHDESTNRHPWRDQTPSCSPSCSIQARSVLTAVPASFAVASRNNKPTKHQGHQLVSTARVLGHTRCGRHRGGCPSPCTCPFA